MENVKFNLDEWFEEQGKINTQLIHSNKNIGLAIKSIKDDSIDTLTKQVGELTTEIRGLGNKMRDLENENENIKEDNVKIIGDLHKIKEKTDVIEFEDTETMGKIKKQAKVRISKLLGGEGTPQYKILFRSCISNLYSKIGDNLCGGKRIGKVKVEDGKSAISIAKNYYLNDKIINKKIQALRKEQEKGLLSKDKSIALDLTAEWMEERIYG
ncbi:hypothetical protein FC831_17070 [Clostridium botulinum]|nr:hypothetical protein [Clostridium botulinum]